MSHFKEELIHIKAFAFDVDGVFSNSNVYLYPTGELLRTMNIKDGYAVQYAVKQGFPIAIITGGFSESVRTRFQGLGVTDVYLKCLDKRDALEDFCFKYGLQPDELMYMGDDIPDYEAMTKVRLAVCPSNAVPEIQAISHYISHLPGGEGCVRDVMEQVMRAQGKWFNPSIAATWEKDGTVS
jgi:3-deoxy-D-manno-octulosonate 8-phosphate phosphatase (KDO 8-P phosphatase)